MLSLIEVKCPHCGANGQIMLPPVGTIIIGPCPECQGLVVVFCGHVLPLAKEVMSQGTIVEKREHLVTALTQFIRERVDLMIREDEIQGESSAPEPAVPEEAAAPRHHEALPVEKPPPTAPPISEDEVRVFSSIELKLLDNSDYFRTIFN